MTISEPAVGVSNDARPQKRPAAFSLSNPLAAAMAERGVYYGWFVAGATFLVMLATAGAMGAPGVIIQPLEKEFGWSTAQISVALAVRLALFGLIAPFAAAFINRFGVRPVVVSAVAMIVAGILASMAMTQVWELVALGASSSASAPAWSRSCSGRPSRRGGSFSAAASWSAC